MTYVDDSHPSEFYRFDTSFFNCLPLSTMSTVAAEWIEVERDPNPLLPVNMNNQRLTSIWTTGKIFTPSLWDGASCSWKRIQMFEQIYSNCGKNSGGSSFPFAVWSRGVLIFFTEKRPKYRVFPKFCVSAGRRGGCPLRTPDSANEKEVLDITE